jgi:hypothetical protein
MSRFGQSAKGIFLPVERTVGWVTLDRRVSQDSASLPPISEAVSRVAMSHVMGHRLAQIVAYMTGSEMTAITLTLGCTNRW